MRLVKPVPIGEAGSLETVAVKELTGREIINIFDLFITNKDKDIRAALQGDLPAVFRLFDGCLEYPAGKSFADLAYSEIEAVGAAFMEINRPFFGRVEQILGMLGLSAAPAFSAAPVVPLSSADMSTASTTDTPSS